MGRFSNSGGAVGRAAVALVLVSTWAAVRSPVSAQTTTHHYTQADLYAGCLVGYLIPALRRGSPHGDAMAMAEDRCFGLSKGLSETDLRDVIDKVNFFVAVEEEG